MTEHEYHDIIKKILYDYRSCNLGSYAVREQITNEVVRETRQFLTKEERQRIKEIIRRETK